jgi:hypothetical protein
VKREEEEEEEETVAAGVVVTVDIADGRVSNIEEEDNN